MPRSLIAVTLYSGCGLVEVGLEQAGFEVVGAVEKNPDLAEWHQINHPRCKMKVGSVEEFDYRQFLGIDLLHLSPPCQEYSQARNSNLSRHEGADAGLLALKAIDQALPKFITLENVPGYLKADSYVQIKKHLWEIGYYLKENIFNAADYGIPQSRRRLISVWIRGDVLSGNEVPISHTEKGFFGEKYWHSPFPKKQPTKQGWYSAIADLLPSLPETELTHWQIERLPKEIKSHLLDDLDETIHTQEKPASTVCAHGSPPALLIYRDGNRGEMVRVFYPEQPSPTIKAMGHNDHCRQLDGWEGKTRRIVKILPRALARLQTVPDSFQLPKNTVLARIGIGNGVPCELMRQIAASLITLDVRTAGPPPSGPSISLDYTCKRRGKTVNKPIFIPLKRQYFEAFKNGSKQVEYRRVGGRFTQSNCPPGREVTLSLGYGTRNRIEGTVSRSWVEHHEHPTGPIADCYGTDPIDILAVEIMVDRDSPEFSQTTPPKVQPPRPPVVTGIEEVKSPLQQSQLHKKGLCDYVINVASGCLHGCTFCYVPSTPAIRARQQHLQDKGVENPQHDWGKYLLTRDAIAQQLEQTLANKRTWQKTSAGKGVVMLCSGTDPYQNKRTASITRACVEVLLKYGKRVRILTRSPLWTQDLDILANPLVTVGMSLPHLDDRLSRKIEPHAPLPSDRYRALQEGAAAGCRVFVAMAPTPPQMGLPEFQEHLSQLMTINPEVIFWEPINARGTNGLRMIEAGLDFAQDISNSKAWADNFIRQWRELEVAASLTGCQELLHIWPDKALKGYLDSEELEHWWSRPTKEKWSTQVDQIDTSKKVKPMFATELSNDYNLSENINTVDFEGDSFPKKIVPFSTGPHNIKETEPLTLPLIDAKIASLTEEIESLEEQARIRREQISQLQAQAKTRLKSDFSEKLKALTELFAHSEQYGLTDDFCKELNRLHAEVCPNLECEKPVNADDQDATPGSRPDPEEDPPKQVTPEDLESTSEYLEQEGLSGAETTAEPISRAEPEPLPEEPAIEQVTPPETKPKQLTPGDIRIQDDEKWYFEKPPNKKSLYCTNFAFGEFRKDDTKLPEILKMRLTNRGKKPLERICKWAIAEGFAEFYTIYEKGDPLKKLSSPDVQKPEANIILTYPNALKILIEQMTSGEAPPASRDWAGKVGELFYPGDRVRCRELDKNKQWVERDYIVSGIKQQPAGTYAISPGICPPATGYVLHCAQTGRRTTAMPWVKWGNSRPAPLELIEPAPTFGNACKAEPYSGINVGDRVTVEAIPDEDENSLSFNEWANLSEDWNILTIAAFLDDGRVALTVRSENLGNENTLTYVVPPSVITPLCNEEQQPMSEQEQLIATFDFADATKACLWEGWFTDIVRVGKVLSEKVQVSRSPRSKSIQLSNLTNGELAILNNLELPETIPSPAAAQEMWAIATTNATTTS